VGLGRLARSRSDERKAIAKKKRGRLKRESSLEKEEVREGREETLLNHYLNKHEKNLARVKYSRISTGVCSKQRIQRLPDNISMDMCLLGEEMD
jgi:hypothetical protein